MTEMEVTTAQLQGYRLAAFSARTQTTGGGTCIYVKDSVSFNTVNLGIGFNVEKCIEYCYVCLSEFGINVLTLYRSPSGPLDTFLASLDAVLNRLGTGKQVILAGDFNIDLCNMGPSGLRDILNSANLQQTIYQPTRGKNCIDNIFVDSEMVFRLATVCEMGFSDHKGQLVTVSVNKTDETEIKKTCRPITQRGKNLFYNIISGVSWDFVNERSMNVDERFSVFMSILENAYMESFPEKEYKVKSRQEKKTKLV